MQLITIKESHFASNFAILKSRLESDGIDCYIEGELTSQVLNHIPSMQAALKIYKSDFEKAKEIMIQNGEWQKEYAKIVCPKCGSENYGIKRTLKEKWQLLVAILLSLITFASFENNRSAKLICTQCEHEFYG